jgi:hypothetical protein
LDGSGGADGRITANVGTRSKLLNYGGTLQLFYYDTGNNNLRHAWAGNQGWKFENLDGDNGSIARNNGDAGIDVTASYNPSTGKLLLVYKHGTGIKYAWSNNTGWHFAYLDGTPYSLTGQTFAAPASNPIILPYGQSLQVFYSNSGVLKHAWTTQ